MADPRDQDYYLKKGQQCFRLADDCSSERLSRELRAIGLQFFGLAVDCGADPRLVPVPEPEPAAAVIIAAAAEP